MMKQKEQVLQLLKSLSFTTKELAVFTEVSESMINQLRRGTRMPSEQLQKKIIAFVKKKMDNLNQLLEKLNDI